MLTSRADYSSNVLAYWQVASRTGAEVSVVPNDEHGQLNEAALARMASDRRGPGPLIWRELIWTVTGPAWVGPDPPVAFLRARHEAAVPGRDRRLAAPLDLVHGSG
ncbi:MAG: hypothetical protein WA895_22920, partial [Streptosporangiaceae bacterium]